MSDDLEILALAMEQSGKHPENWEILEEQLKLIPAVGKRKIYWGYQEYSGIWWCTFQLIHDHPHFFQTIHVLAHHLNHYKGSDFSGAFYPTGPDYLINEGHQNFLEWMIDSFTGKDGPKSVARDILPGVNHLIDLAEEMPG